MGPDPRKQPGHEGAGRRGGKTIGENPKIHGFLVRRHGLYTWGHDIPEAARHVEIFEFLLESVGRRQMMEPQY